MLMWHVELGYETAHTSDRVMRIVKSADTALDAVSAAVNSFIRCSIPGDRIHTVKCEDWRLVLARQFSEVK